MTEYLIAFNDEWVPDFPEERWPEISRASSAVVEEMRAAGLLVYTNGGLIPGVTPVFSVEPVDGEPVVRDGRFHDTEEHLGGFLVADLPDEDAARYWAGRIAVATGWAQEVLPFERPGRRP